MLSVQMITQHEMLKWWVNHFSVGAMLLALVLGWGCSLVVEHLPGMHGTLGLITSTAKQQQQNTFIVLCDM
jgi:hypothetical protein